MKIKSFMTMMVAMTAVVCGFSACGSDDDGDVPLASQVVGSYAGDEKVVVSTEGYEEAATYVFTKNTDSSIDLAISAWGEGAMSFPQLPVKGVVLTQTGDIISGKLMTPYTGTVKDTQGEDKSYTVSDLVVVFSKNKVVLTYTLKYGRMPFDFVGQFVGTKK
jgi:hypothetical protein